MKLKIDLDQVNPLMDILHLWTLSQSVPANIGRGMSSLVGGILSSLSEGR